MDYDFGDRIYDARIGRWLSVDKRFKDYVPFSPYIFSLNNPIFLIDKDGNVVVDANGNPVTISVTKAENGTATATYEFSKGTSQEVKNQFTANGQAIINDMLITKTGQEQVQHLIDTKTKVTMEVSEDIGIATAGGQYGVIYGNTGPTEKQSSNLVTDYDGGQVYEESTITLYKGSLKYGMGDKSALDEGKITLVNLETGKVKPLKKFDPNKLNKFKYPDKLYKSQFQLFNLGGIHETEHTKSENVKTTQEGGNPEDKPMKKEDDSRSDPNFK